MEQVDLAMVRVAEVFDKDWCHSYESRIHPVWFQIHSRGLNPFQFLSSLGMDLISVATCLRYQQLIEDLRRSEHFSAAFLELWIASQLQQQGHCVELRPELPNGKRADLLTKEDGLGVYVEIKQLSLSDSRKALDQFSLRLLSAIGHFQTVGGVWPKDAGYEIVVSEKMLDSFGAGEDIDEALMEEVVEMAMTELRTRLHATELPLAFDVRGYMNVRVGRGMQSQLSGPPFAPEREGRRVLGKHFKKPNEQLRPEYPGILLIQSAEALDPVMTRRIIEKLLEKQPVHLSVVFFVSVLPPESMAYVFFPAFAVVNPYAQFPAEGLRVFHSLSHIFGVGEPS